MERHNAYFFFSDLIKDENVGDLIEFINKTGNDPIMIGIKSCGGSSTLLYFLQRIFKEQSERISLVAIAGIYSAAFDLFYNFTGKRFLTRETKGMYHWAAQEVTINANSKLTYYEDEAMKRDRKRLKKEQLVFIAKFMTAGEIRKFKEGKDVYFDFSRMQEIFPDAEIL